MPRSSSTPGSAPGSPISASAPIRARCGAWSWSGWRPRWCSGFRRASTRTTATSPDDRHQGLPAGGYTELVGRILDHPNIRVSLDAPFDKATPRDHAFCFNAMPIDEYFDFALGPLPYRSIRFHHRAESSTYTLGETVRVNFTDDGPYTRQSDWSLLPGRALRDTGTKTMALEEPCADHENDMEHYYPAKTSDGGAEALYGRYRALAQAEPRLHFIGRCGTYRYLDMDQVINQSPQSARAWLANTGAAAP